MWPFKRRALASTATPPQGGKRRWKISNKAVDDASIPGSGVSFELTPLIGSRRLHVENPFEPARMPDGSALAMDDQFTATLGGLSAYGGYAGGIGFIGYGILAEMAQRPEYRRGSEVLAREMTRRFIKFTYAGEDETDEEEDENDEDNTSKIAPDQPQPEPGESIDQEPQPDDVEPKPLDAEPAAGPPGTQPVGAAPVAKSTPRVKPSDEKLKKLEAEFRRLKVRDAFRRAAELDGFFGRGHIYIDTGDTDKPDELRTPLLADRRKIRKGKIKRLVVVEPQWIYPQDYDSRDPLKVNFYQPQSWLVMSKSVHASRMMTFVGREVPDLLKPAYSFGGLSLTQMAQPYVDNWLRTRQSVSDLLHAFTVWGIKTDMMAMLSGADDSDQLIKRAALFNQARDNRGLMMVDKEAEEFFNISVPLGGLDKLQAQAQEQMASVFAIPLVVLLGITPSGLNASSDGEIRVFYDFINAFQQHLFGHSLDRLIKLMQLSLFGEIDDDIGFEFLPLWQPTETDQATIRKIKMEIDTGYVNAGVLDPVEIRDTLVADKEGDYNNIDVSAVPEDPNALPPGMNPITGEIDGAGDDDDQGQAAGDDDDLPPSSGSGARAPKPSPAGGSPKPIPNAPIGKPTGGASDEATFREVDHPRQQDGKFGTGGAGGQSKPDRGDHFIEPSKFDAATFAKQHDQAGVTAEDILANFPEDTADKIRMSVDALAARQETSVKFKKDGAYDAERAALHRKIVIEGVTKKVLNEATGELEDKHYPGLLSPERVAAATPKDGVSPTYTILGGRGGSGKSWFNGKVYDETKAIVLDSDHIKQLLPEYEGWNAAQVHDESGELFDKITEMAQEMGLNIVHDSTMKSPEKALSLVKGFKDKGYDVEAHYMHLPRQEAAKRAVERFLGKTKRLVPPQIVLQNTRNEEAFNAVRELADRWSFRDNNVARGEEPKLISENS